MSHQLIVSVHEALTRAGLTEMVRAYALAYDDALLEHAILCLSEEHRADLLKFDKTDAAPTEGPKELLGLPVEWQSRYVYSYIRHR